ncbi:MAG: transposase [Saezia sp.]
MRNNSKPHYYDTLPQSLHKQADELIDYLDRFPVGTPSSCYHCGSERIRIERETKAGAIGYKCISCRKSFNQLTGTPFAWIWFPEKWGDYGYWRLSGLSLPKIADKLEISKDATTIRDERFHIVMKEHFPSLYKWWIKHQEREEVKIPLQVEEQREKLKAYLHELQHKPERACPYCQRSAEKITSPSANLERPEFFCKHCRKAFNPLKGTLFYRLNHINQWIPYVDCLSQGLINDEIGQKLGVSNGPLISWRRVFLKQMELMGLDALKEWVKWQSCCNRQRARVRWREAKQKEQ